MGYKSVTKAPIVKSFHEVRSLIRDKIMLYSVRSTKKQVLCNSHDVTNRAGSAYVGGNSNNDAKVGTFYSNLNNTASNTNWNIGAYWSYILD